MQSFGGGFNSIALGVGDGRPHCYGAYRATIGANGGRACPNVYLPGVGKTQPADDVRCVGGVSGSPATAAPAAQQANPGHEIAPKVAMATRFSATTLMLRNLPRRVTLEILVAELDVSGFLGVWDFLYCPRYKITGACKGFAFLNFHTSVMAKAFLEETFPITVPAVALQRPLRRFLRLSTAGDPEPAEQYKYRVPCTKESPMRVFTCASFE